jgi:hypothetical protein
MIKGVFIAPGIVIDFRFMVLNILFSDLFMEQIAVTLPFP